MATVNFLYRSTKDYSNLELRLLFRCNNEDFVFGTKSRIFVSKEYWKAKHNKKSKDISIINEQNRVNSEIKKLEMFILKAFENENPKFITKDWLLKQVELFYNPNQVSSEIPKDLINYIDFYLEFRKNELTQESVKKINVVKHKLQRFEKDKKKTIYIKDVKNTLKNELIEYYLKNNYSKNTIQREFVSIKSFCNHAKKRGLEVHFELEDFKTEREKVKHIYLTVEELETLNKLTEEKLTESLINARDWLIISCYTGQRVSDFLNFTKDIIREEKGVKLIEFTQKKTKTIMTVPLHPIVLKILGERAGEFPYKISSQKYNDYIKEVCRIAKIDNLIYATKKTEISKGVFRNGKDNFKKYELVTSHIGRRSFSTNFFGKIPTALIISATGHKTEDIFSQYLAKSSTDRALELANYFK